MGKHSRKSIVIPTVKSLRDCGASAFPWLLSFGAALALAPRPSRYEVDPDPFGADHRALQSDWSAVGNDILTGVCTLGGS